MERILSRRDGPLHLALALAVAGVLEAPLHDGSDDVANVILFSTLPVALVRTRLRLTAVIVTFWLLWTVWSQIPLTVAAVLAQLLVAYLVATRHRRIVSALLDLPYLLTAMRSSPAHCPASCWRWWSRRRSWATRAVSGASRSPSATPP